MALELTLDGSMVWSDALGEELVLSVSQSKKTISSQKPVKLFQEIGFAVEEAVLLGDMTAPAYAMFKNLDFTNYIELKVATSGAIFARLDPDTNQDGKGGFAILRLGSGAQAPFAIANTAACRMVTMISPI